MYGAGVVVVGRPCVVGDVASGVLLRVVSLVFMLFGVLLAAFPVVVVLFLRSFLRYRCCERGGALNSLSSFNYSYTGITRGRAAKAMVLEINRGADLEAG